jgi:hypothetical protein
MVNVGLYAGFVGGYGTLLFGLHLLTVDEIRKLWGILTDSPVTLEERIGG